MKRFDIHCHYLFRINIDEQRDIFKEEFYKTNTFKCNFLSIPLEYDIDGTKKEDKLQNLKGLFLKKSFFPNAYAFAGLTHSNNQTSDDFLIQAKELFDAGFDGFKMLEGYPTFIKYSGVNIDSLLYDKFYSFCEEKKVPILLHFANPDENWDINEASKEAIDQGRVYDCSFPTKEEITNQVFNILRKHPKLRLIVAHFGFFCKHYDNAFKFLNNYENTIIDITPGGEQLIHMSTEWGKWHKYFIDFQDRIVYGTDFYAFPRNENYETCYTRRPNFVSDFFEDDLEHVYLDSEFKGVNLERKIVKKIYYKNAERLLGLPRTINMTYVSKEIERFNKMNLNDFDRYDIEYMKKCFK